MDLRAFAEEVGTTGPVAPLGGNTQWRVRAPIGKVVRPPAGIVTYEPAEMTVRVLAGTTVAELSEVLAAHGQMVPLDPSDPDHATVGGVLAEGASGIRRLRYGPVRDTVLEVRYVSAAGTVVKAGGPVVKNVSGFDLCRLLVGSKGTLGVLAEVVLRVQPVPQVARWLMGRADPFGARATLHRPSAILWDGQTTWVLLEGHAADVAAGVSSLRGFVDVAGPPTLPRWRLSLRPAELRALKGDFVAEIGVGTVHLGGDDEDDPDSEVERPDRVDLHRRVKDLFDPSGRLNPGRMVA